MAKDKAGKRAKADKDARSGPKIPKHIAGVKIPKALRDSGKAAIKLAQNPMARELLSAGLVAAASAVALKSQAKRGGASGMNGAAKGTDDMADIGAALAGAAGAAAQRFFKAGRDKAERKRNESGGADGVQAGSVAESADQVAPEAMARASDGVVDAPAVRPAPPRRKPSPPAPISPNGKA